MSERDLEEAGWGVGDDLAAMVARAREYEEAKGIRDRKYLMKLLRREFGGPDARLRMRDVGAAPAVAEAIVAEGADEEANVATVRRLMGELARVPVVGAGAVMPDACPAGVAPATIPVGGVVATEGAILPTAHGMDICCSMYASFYRSGMGVGERLDALVASTRFGRGGRSEGDEVYHPVVDEDVWGNDFLYGLEGKARAHLADQGDGNHFAFLGEVEIGSGAEDGLRRSGVALGAGRYEVLVTHHGSRGLGASVFKRGQAAAEKHTARVADGVPKAAAWLDVGEAKGRAYWEALQYVGRWTRANHEMVHARYLAAIGERAEAAFGNEHNFVWRRGDRFLHGKGATPAWGGADGAPLPGLIPLNMAAPILMVLGRDNREFLSFAPHGAGRNVSRTALRRRFRGRRETERAIEEGTAGIDVRWYCGRPDVSETPVAYKDAGRVRAQIARFGLADVVAEIRPQGCVMAGETPRRGEWEDEPLTPKQKRQMAHRAERRRGRQRGWDEAG